MRRRKKREEEMSNKMYGIVVFNSGYITPLGMYGPLSKKFSVDGKTLIQLQKEGYRVKIMDTWTKKEKNLEEPIVEANQDIEEPIVEANQDIEEPIVEASQIVDINELIDQNEPPYELPAFSDEALYELTNKNLKKMITEFYKESLPSKQNKDSLVGKVKEIYNNIFE